MFTLYRADHRQSRQLPVSHKYSIAMRRLCQKRSGVTMSALNTRTVTAAEAIFSALIVCQTVTTTTEEASDWVTPTDIATAFPSVTFAVHYSRNNMKEKTARRRPKFHVLFPIDSITDARLYADMKKMVSGIPIFDRQFHAEVFLWYS